MPEEAQLLVRYPRLTALQPGVPVQVLRQAPTQASAELLGQVLALVLARAPAQLPLRAMSKLQVLSVEQQQAPAWVPAWVL